MGRSLQRQRSEFRRHNRRAIPLPRLQEKAMIESELRQFAVKAGATELGDPPHYIFSAEELARFVAVVSAVDTCRQVVAREIAPCPC